MRWNPYRYKNTPSVQTKAETPFFDHHSEQVQPLYKPKKVGGNQKLYGIIQIVH